MPLPLLGIVAAAAVTIVGGGIAYALRDDDDDDDDGTPADAEELRAREAARDRKRKKRRVVQWMGKSLQDLAERHSATGRRVVDAEGLRDLAKHYLAPGRRPDRAFGSLVSAPELATLLSGTVGAAAAMVLPSTKTPTANPREVLDKFLPKDGPTDTEQELADLERNVTALKGLKEFVAVRASAPIGSAADADHGDKER